MEFDELSRRVIGCAIEVHRQLGPGLLESTYRQCLACELSFAGISFQMELPLPVRYKDLLLDCGYRIDLLKGADLIVETKSVETLLQFTRHKFLPTCGWPKFQSACLSILTLRNCKTVSNGSFCNSFVLFVSFVVPK